MIIADTSGLLAAFDTDEPDHAECAAVIADERGPFILSPLVLAEIDYMVSRRLVVGAEVAFLEDVRLGRYVLAEFDRDDFGRALDLVKQYRDLDIGMADASNVVLAHRYEAARMFTLDDHYRAVRPLNGADAFTLLPADR